jgi:hypothetical protein
MGGGVIAVSPLFVSRAESRMKYTGDVKIILSPVAFSKEVAILRRLRHPKVRPDETAI